MPSREARSDFPHGLLEPARVPNPFSTARAVAGFLLVAAVAQIAASVHMGLFPLGALEAVAARSPTPVLVGLGTAGAGLFLVWSLRRRRALALLMLLGWPLAVYLPLRGRVSTLAASYWVEAVSHHFLALGAGGVSAALAVAWWRAPQRGLAGRVVALALATATALTLAAHLDHALGPAPRLPQLQAAGLALSLLAAAAALVRTGLSVRPRRHVVVAAALLLPALVRVAAAGPAGLTGAPVPHGLERAVVATLVVAGAVTWALVRPRLETWLRLVTLAGSAVGTSAIYLLYVRFYGDLEDGLDELVRSFFGFPIPYPSHVPPWAIVTTTVALFFFISTAYAALVSTADRPFGQGLGLLVLTGLGLSSPQLVAMASAGYLLLLESLWRAQPPARERAPAQPVPTTLEHAARHLAWELPVRASSEREEILALHGEVDGVPAQVRARRRRGRWRLQIEVGTVGRSRPPVALEPSPPPAGLRPPHPIGRTHRVRGSIRALEPVGDAPLDALLAFPAARLELWPSGARAELGADLAELDETALTALLRALARAVA